VIPAVDIGVWPRDNPGFAILALKRLQLLKEAVPKAMRIAFLAMKEIWETPVGQQLVAINIKVRPQSQEDEAHSSSCSSSRSRGSNNPIQDKLGVALAIDRLVQ
jgi:hypothetical protein